MDHARWYQNIVARCYPFFWLGNLATQIANNDLIKCPVWYVQCGMLRVCLVLFHQGDLLMSILEKKMDHFCFLKAWTDS